MASYHQIDLFCNRRKRNLNNHSRNSDETDEAFNQRQQCDVQRNKDNVLLNAKSQAVIQELSERHWALMYLKHLANRVTQTESVRMQFSDLLPITSLSSHNPEGSSSNSLRPLRKYKASIEQHLEVLEQRRRDAQIEMEPSWAALNILALGLTLGIQGNPEDVDIAFRLFDNESHAPFFADKGDIRCSNWQQFDISQPQEKKEAERHIAGDPIPTNYISISTSPRRIWSFAIRKFYRADRKIAVIDLRVLRRLGIAYGSSTDDLRFNHYNGMNGTGTLLSITFLS